MIKSFEIGTNFVESDAGRRLLGYEQPMYNSIPVKLRERYDMDLDIRSRGLFYHTHVSEIMKVLHD